MSTSDWADGLADTIFPTQPDKREVPLVTNRDEEPVAPPPPIPPPIPAGLAGSPEERKKEQAAVDRLVNRRTPVTVKVAPKPGYPVNLGKHAQALAAHRRANPVYALMPCGVETGDGPCVLAAGHTWLGTVAEHVPAKPVVWQYGPQWLAENVAREVLDGEQV
jgi:hypothetical protein